MIFVYGLIELMDFDFITDLLQKPPPYAIHNMIHLLTIFHADVCCDKTIRMQDKQKDSHYPPCCRLFITNAACQSCAALLDARTDSLNKY